MSDALDPSLFYPAGGPAAYHPCPDENGQPLIVSRPSRSTAPETWLDPTCDAVLSRTERAETLPPELNGRGFNPDFSLTDDARRWMRLIPDAVPDEPDFVLPPGFRATSGCIVIEPDSRVWIAFPSNQFAGFIATFPKGRLEPILSLAQNAAKETWEETGLFVEPVAWLVDIRRTRVITRYYVARRIDGSPASAGWESQAVGLVAPERLEHFINRENDRKVIDPLKHWLQQHGSDAFRCR